MAELVVWEIVKPEKAGDDLLLHPFEALFQKHPDLPQPDMERLYRTSEKREFIWVRVDWKRKVVLEVPDLPAVPVHRYPTEREMQFGPNA